MLEIIFDIYCGISETLLGSKKIKNRDKIVLLVNFTLFCLSVYFTIKFFIIQKFVFSIILFVLSIILISFIIFYIFLENENSEE